MATDDKLASEEGPTGLNIIDLFVELIEDSLDGIQFGSQDTDDCYLKGISENRAEVGYVHTGNDSGRILGTDSARTDSYPYQVAKSVTCQPFLVAPDVMCSPRQSVQLRQNSS
jgi:hypothetical protein